MRFLRDVGKGGLGDLLITTGLCSYLCAYYRVSPYAGHYWSSIMPGFAQAIPCSIIVGLLIFDGTGSTLRFLRGSKWFRILCTTLAWNVVCALVSKGWRYALIQADPGALWDNLLLALHLLSVVHAVRTRHYWVWVCGTVFAVGVAVNIWNLHAFYTSAEVDGKLEREWRAKTWLRRFEYVRRYISIYPIALTLYSVGTMASNRILTQLHPRYLQPLLGQLGLACISRQGRSMLFVFLA